MDLKEIGINTRNWVDSAQDRDYWRVLLDAALNLQVPYDMEIVNGFTAFVMFMMFLLVKSYDDNILLCGYDCVLLNDFLKYFVENRKFNEVILYQMFHFICIAIILIFTITFISEINYTCIGISYKGTNTGE